MRRTFHPPIEPDASGLLSVGDGHELYWEQCGAKDGLPVVVLHGGPGGASNPWMRRYFDSARWRVTLFDQRGCGKSRPFSSLHANTTWDLVADIERLREMAGVEKWCVFGGSWGSTLALAYAQAHPHRVSALILRGVFLMTQEELDWLYRDGANRLFPDAWARLVAPIPEGERGDILSAFHRRLIHGDADTRREAARAWSQYEGDLLSIDGPAARPSAFNDDAYVDAFARIETHYFVNSGFLDRDNQLLDDAPRIAGLPSVIVNGRYDVLTPPRAAFRLHAALPGSRLVIAPGAGHAASDPGIVDALVRGADEIATILRDTSIPAAKAGGNAEAVPLVDRTTLDPIMKVTGIAVMRRIVDTFWSLTDEMTGDLRAAIAANDAPRLRNAAHTLKGAASNVGAGRVTAIADAMERAAPDQAGAMMGELDLALAATRPALEEILHDAS